MLVEVYTHDGGKFTVTVENYDPNAINDAINDRDRATIVIGDAIFHRTNISRVVPVQE